MSWFARWEEGEVRWGQQNGSPRSWFIWCISPLILALCEAQIQKALAICNWCDDRNAVRVWREMQMEVWDDGQSQQQCGEQADGKVCFIVKFALAPLRTTWWIVLFHVLLLLGQLLIFSVCVDGFSFVCNWIWLISGLCLVCWCSNTLQLLSLFGNHINRFDRRSNLDDCLQIVCVVSRLFVWLLVSLIILLILARINQALRLLYCSCYLFP